MGAKFLKKYFNTASPAAPQIPLGRRCCDWIQDCCYLAVRRSNPWATSIKLDKISSTVIFEERFVLLKCMTVSVHPISFNLLTFVTVHGVGAGYMANLWGLCSSLAADTLLPVPWCPWSSGSHSMEVCRGIFLKLKKFKHIWLETEYIMLGILYYRKKCWFGQFVFRIPNFRAWSGYLVPDPNPSN
jgi:hypothetical protein